jgi:hypothetical protein
MLKIVIGIVLLAHGIGHVLGLFPVVGVAPMSSVPKWTGESWLLPSGQATLAHIVGGVLWAVALVGFLLVSFIVFGWLPETWWQPMAIGASVVSIVAIALFPSGFPTAVNVVGALVVDIALLVAATVYQWAPSALDS